MDRSYFVHRSTGRLEYDRSDGQWWVRVKADGGISAYYSRLARSYGIPLMTFAGKWTHITVVRNERPPNEHLWGRGDGQEVEFFYSHCCRWTPYHLWVDVYSDQMRDLRADLGFPPKLQKRLSDGRVLEHSFHLTVGRRT